MSGVVILDFLLCDCVSNRWTQLYFRVLERGPIQKRSELFRFELGEFG